MFVFINLSILNNWKLDHNRKSLKKQINFLLSSPLSYSFIKFFKYILFFLSLNLFLFLFFLSSFFPNSLLFHSLIFLLVFFSLLLFNYSLFFPSFSQTVMSTHNLLPCLLLRLLTLLISVIKCLLILLLLLLLLLLLVVVGYAVCQSMCGVGECPLTLLLLCLLGPTTSGLQKEIN